MRYLLLVMLLLVGCADAETADTSATPDVSDAGVSDVHSDVPDAPDASESVDADEGEPDADEVDVPSRCTRDDGTLTCPYDTITLQTGITGVYPRDVHFQVPATEPPPGGFPVVLLFQGSLFSGEFAFEARETDPFGAIHQVEFVQLALDRGFAVLSPEARINGSTFWDTNVPPYSLDWDLAPDHQFMLDIFDAIEAGEFGPLDGGTMYATGISSGGYMTSRMAVSYPGRFRALAVLSASYATCSGALCVIPDLPADHPPTLFVHGELDAVVPIGTARDYYDELQPVVATEFVASEDGGHAWLPEGPAAIVEWFEAY